MSLAAEMRDFLGAFKTVHDTFGTVSSREGQRLDNEYRRATIDYTRARTAEIGGTGVDFPAWIAARGGYSGTPLDTSYTEGAPAAPATSTAAGALEIGAGAPNTGGAGTFFTGDTPGMPNPRPRPGTRPAATAPGIPDPHPRPTGKTAALDTAEVPGTEAIARTGGEASAAMVAAGITPPSPRGRPSYQVSIGDHTSWRGMQPKALQIANTMGQTAQQMGIRLVATAGAGGGHRSHSMGTESDWMGYHTADGSKWTRAERARIAAAGGSVGANRFGLYPGGSLHVGYSGPDRPSAVWGAHGILNGGSARDFTDPADRQFLALFQGGKLYGSGGTYSQDYNSGDFLGRARNAIGNLESRGHGDYAARNGDALGRYMIRVGNLPEWSKAALGREVTPEEFMRSPEIQDAIFNNRFGTLFEKYGNVQDAASAWFTGRPLAGGGAGAHDANITGREYVDRFNKEFGATDYASDLGQERGDVVRGTPRDDSMPAYPDSATPEADPAAVAALLDTGPEDYRGTTRSAVPAGTPSDIIHTVVKHDTLTKLAKKYNLDSYQIIYDANKAIIGNDPNKLSIGQQLRIPGVADPAALIPDPQARPDPRDAASVVSAVGDGDIRQQQMSGMAGMGDGGLDVNSEIARTQAQAAARRAETRDARAVFPKVSGRYYEKREAAVPVDPTFEGRRVAIQPQKGGPPTDQRPWWDVFSEPQMTDKGQDQVPLSTEDYPQPAIQYDFRPGHPVLMSPDERLPPVTNMGVTPVDPYAPPGTNPANVTPPPWAPFDAELGGAGTAGAQGALGDVGLPGAAGEALTPGVKEEPISGTDMSGVDDGRMSVIETAIREASGAYNVTSYGHMVHPNGSVAADSTFTSGRKAAIAGSSWLSRQLGLSGAVDDEPPGAPDDGTPTAASAKLSGTFAAKQSEMAQAQSVVTEWARKNNIPITESELNVRSLGLVFDYWLSRGEPEKAQAIAAAMFQYHQVRYNQYSAIAKAALGEGDHEKAVEAAIKAYAQIPDGRDITVSGDAASGWKVRYTDEETGKVINEKILSPAEMEGMIMNMAPGDVDKFLAKAAHQEELPEASPQLVKFLADLNATPDGVKPTIDYAALATMDSAETQIALRAAADQTAQYDEFTGGAAGRATAADKARMFPSETGGGEATPTPTPAAAPAGASVTPGVEGVGAVDTGSVAPTTSTTPAAPMPARTAADGYPAGESTAERPDVFFPGKDNNFGMGEPPPTDYQKYFDAQSAIGLAVTQDQHKDVLAAYDRVKKQREFAYQTLVSSLNRIPSHAAAEPTPALPEARTKDDEFGGPSIFDIPKVPGELLGNITRNATAALEDLPAPESAFLPDIRARLTPDIAPGPLSTLEGYGMLDRPKADNAVLAALSGSPYLEGYKSDIAEQQRLWQRLYDVAQQEYKDDTAPPTPRKFTGDTVREEFDTAFGSFRTTHLGAPPAEEGVSVETGTMEEMRNAAASTAGDVTKIFLDHLDRNAEFVKSAALTIGELNHMTIQGATDITASMIMPNRDKPWTPWFVAVDQPGQPNMKRVQLVHNDGTPDQGSFLVPKDTFEALQQTWQQGRDEWLGNAKYQKVFSLSDVFSIIPGKNLTRAEIELGTSDTRLNNTAVERGRQLERQLKESTSIGSQKERDEVAPAPSVGAVPIGPPPEKKFIDVGPRLGIPHPSIW